MTAQRPQQATSDLASAFRQAFGGHPAGVAIVTAAGADGPVGITASSVISVSADPAALAFSVSTDSTSGAAVLAGDTVAVHLLTIANRRLAELFARPGSRRFGTDVDWYAASTGEPIIRGVGTVLRCAIVSRTPVGAGVLAAARVLQVSDGGSPAAPLVYRRRAYYGLEQHAALRSRRT